jgi:alkaline phosphatase D
MSGKPVVSIPPTINNLDVKENSMPEDHAQIKFDQTTQDPFYKVFKENTPQIIGVYDDHDYGVNNGDMTFARKHLYREMYLNFIGEPEGTERRLENDSGIY